MKTKVEKYGSRFWAIYSEREMLAVTVYRKGARRLQEILEKIVPEDESQNAVEVEP
ncbi:MAG: hypothetical protein IAE94_07080 [Chthoniobacterales bacterium]|mgnify:CR=1 FL=1|nr:hypothetical protein [Chthoniobacterales bacterium]